MTILGKALMCVFAVHVVLLIFVVGCSTLADRTSWKFERTTSHQQTILSTNVIPLIPLLVP